MQGDWNGHAGGSPAKCPAFSLREAGRALGVAGGFGPESAAVQKVLPSSGPAPAPRLPGAVRTNQRRARAPRPSAGLYKRGRRAALRSRGLCCARATGGRRPAPRAACPTFAPPQTRPSRLRLRLRLRLSVSAAAGAMRLGPRPAALGLLLLLCAPAAGAGDAQGEHRADYDREALLGGQVSGPDRAGARRVRPGARSLLPAPPPPNEAGSPGRVGAGALQSGCE